MILKLKCCLCLQGFSARNFSWTFCDFVTHAFEDHSEDEVASYFDAGSAISGSDRLPDFADAKLYFPLNRLQKDMSVVQLLLQRIIAVAN